MVSTWWRRVLGIYAHPNVLRMSLLGFSGGLPMFLTANTLTYWLTKIGVTYTKIGLFALVATPYSFRFMWAPVVDRVPIPWLTERLGRRRSWALLSQFFLLLSILALGSCDPSQHIELVGIFALCVAISSATQDIVLDAYRTEILSKDQYGAGASVYVFGYRLGLMVAGSGAIYCSTFLGWNTTYYIMALCVLVGPLMILLSPEPEIVVGHVHTDDTVPHQAQGKLTGGLSAITAAFATVYDLVHRVMTDFSKRPRWVAILMFIMLYKLSDNLIGCMSNPFYISLGFSDAEIAYAVNYGLWASILGSLPAGLFVSRFGLYTTLLLCGVLESASNLVFVILSYVGPDLAMFHATVVIEGITSALAVTAFVAYLSSMCSISYTATHYALMTSLSAFGRTFFAAASGWTVDQFGWVIFFMVTALAGIPSVVLLLVLRRSFSTMDTNDSQAIRSTETKA